MPSGTVGGRTRVLSPTFGTLALFHVEDGGRVEAGDAICEIEVMKTFYRVTAEVSGIIRWKMELGELAGTDDVIGEIET